MFVLHCIANANGQPVKSFRLLGHGGDAYGPTARRTLLEERSAAWFKYAAFRRALEIEEKRPYPAPEDQGAW